MSDTTVPQGNSEPTHDSFQAPVGPDVVDGAALNKAHEDNVRQALAQLQDGEQALRDVLAKLPDAPGHKVIAGARVAYGRALAALQAEILSVRDEIAKLPPAAL